MLSFGQVVVAEGLGGDLSNFGGHLVKIVEEGPAVLRVMLGRKTGLEGIRRIIRRSAELLPAKEEWWLWFGSEQVSRIKMGYGNEWIK
jgi:hypothetical protein